jgi:hypothetical protein
MCSEQQQDNMGKKTQMWFFIAGQASIARPKKADPACKKGKPPLATGAADLFWQDGQGSSSVPWLALLTIRETRCNRSTGASCDSTQATGSAWHT